MINENGAVYEKRLSVSRKMEEKRAECLERITSDYGTCTEHTPGNRL